MAEKIGQILVRKGKINPSQLREALRTQQFFGGYLGSHLINLGFIDEAALGETLSEIYRVPFAPFDSIRLARQEVLAKIPATLAQRYRLVPIQIEGNRLHLAMLNPRDAVAIGEVSAATGLNVTPWVAPEFRIIQALEKHYRLKKSGRGPIKVKEKGSAAALPPVDEPDPEPVAVRTEYRPLASDAIGLDGHPIDATVVPDLGDSRLENPVSGPMPRSLEEWRDAEDGFPAGEAVDGSPPGDAVGGFGRGASHDAGPAGSDETGAEGTFQEAAPLAYQREAGVTEDGSAEWGHERVSDAEASTWNALEREGPDAAARPGEASDREWASGEATAVGGSFAVPFLPEAAPGGAPALGPRDAGTPATGTSGRRSSGAQAPQPPSSRRASPPAAASRRGAASSSGAGAGARDASRRSSGRAASEARAAAAELPGRTQPEASQGALRPPMELEQLAEILCSAASRDDVAREVVTFVASRFRRAAAFAIRQERAAGWIGSGRGFDPARLRAISVPVAGSIFSVLTAAQSLYVGPLAASPESQELFAALGGVIPNTILLVPILLRERLVTALYADNETDPLGAVDLALFKRLGKMTEVALEIIILKNKLKQI